MVGILGDDAYGVNLTHEIIGQTGRAVRLNQVHASLHRLEEKGMIISRMGDPTPERGGRRKRYFRITAYGDYGVANALGCLSYLMTGVVAWIYLRHGVRGAAAS